MLKSRRKPHFLWKNQKKLKKSSNLIWLLYFEWYCIGIDILIWQASPAAWQGKNKKNKKEQNDENERIFETA